MQDSQTKTSRHNFAVVANPDGTFKALAVDGMGPEAISQFIEEQTNQPYCYQVTAADEQEAIKVAVEDSFGRAEL